MSTALVPRPQALPTNDPALLPLDDLMAEAEAYARQARAEATIKAYRHDWRDFTGWCERRGVCPLPALPETVALYLVELSHSRRYSTLQRRLSSLSKVHQAAGLASPTSSHQVSDTLAGLRRRMHTAQRGVAPATIEVVLQMLATLGDDLRGLRDRALLLVGFAGAMRRSELVGLDVEDVTWEAEGLRVVIRQSKTDQAGQGHVLGLPLGSRAETCPARSLRAWLAAADVRDGALFRSLDRHGHVRGRLGDQDVARIIKRCAKDAGLDPTLYSGHSLRAGFATTAAKAGVDERDIMRQTRHSSERMVRCFGAMQRARGIVRQPSMADFPTLNEGL